MLAYLDPEPTAGELPARFPSPFADAPHPIARRAAEELVAALRGGAAAAGGADLDAPGGGKMFGVLVVADAAGRIGYLRAFSGMLGGQWDVPGFAPPAFDAAAREAFWPAGEAGLGVLAEESAALARAAAPLRAALAGQGARQAAERDELRARHAGRRAERHAARGGKGAASGGEGAAGGDGGAAAALAHALDQASRADGAERRAQRAAHAAARAAPAAELAALDAARHALDLARAARSRVLLEQLQDTYTLANARGERRSLRALFLPREPPGGAGDCAGPKLLAAAYRAGLRPIALAEVWWGAPPLAGGRHAGRLYPACRGKCGPILGHMLGGLSAEAPPVFGAAPGASELRVVFEDEWLVVVDKPAGLLTVPGKTGELADCLLARLRARHPDALVAHRLDLDTSGLVVAAKDRETHAALQGLFARREVDKRYDATLERAPREGRGGGVIELPLRVDLEDRPRQIVDPVHGRPAITEWRLVERLPGGRARVVFLPRTGRTHQLRVHAAHPLGLDAPIVGDRLYGSGGDGGGALMLRAVSLSFVHPARGTRLSLTA
ncbi:MAG TPA: RluA family pseudouridine synthase [Kofleriaceae bacterium]|nr:RluA family pseudouridine synthase [Kofleriaceae bacterium]